MEDVELDTAHFLTAGVAVSAVAGAAAWLVYLVGEAITTGEIGIPEHQGARASTVLTVGSISAPASSPASWRPPCFGCSSCSFRRRLGSSVGSACS